ncbi:MAG TPA: hypothetical protein VG651_08505 [Stellaceae bacterium]|nr:hypothetical protein [Stellaceae bacterium]
MTPGRRATTTGDRLRIAQAERVELENQVRAGRLLDADKVRTEWASIVLAIKSRLMAIPARVAAAHPNNPAIVATLETELTAALNEIATDEL